MTLQLFFTDKSKTISSQFSPPLTKDLQPTRSTAQTQLDQIQLDPGLPDRQKSGGQNGQQHIISPDPQHWCTAGLRPQPTPVLPVHTRLYSYTQLQCHRQIC